MNKGVSVAKGQKISAEKVVITSFLVDILDVSMNTAVAVVTGSVVMVAEALQGFADLTAAGFVLLGLKKSKQAPDKKHPFGYGKELYFWTLIASIVMITITASLSFYLGLKRFISPEPVENIVLAYLVLFVALIFNSYSLSLGTRRLLGGKSFSNIVSIFHQSPRVESKTTTILDLMGTSAAFLGLTSLLVYGLLGNMRFDGLGAMLIGLAMAGLAVVLLFAIKGFLVGKVASGVVEQKIKEAALKVGEVEEVLDLKTMQIGSEKILVNIEVHLKENLSTEEIEKVIDEIKHQVTKSVSEVTHIQVELETPKEELK